MKNYLKKGLSLILILLTGALAFAGGQKEGVQKAAEQAAGQAKYVFLFIGDGMAMPQVSAAEAYLSAKDGKSANQRLLNFSQFPAQGMTTTYAYDRFITGSAAAATAMATGSKTAIGVISMNPEKSQAYKTLAEMAKENGKKVGIVSSVDLDHATPAAFYAHQPSRNNYYDIGVEAVNSEVDYFGGGRFRISKTPEGAQNVHDLMKTAGWTIAENRPEMDAVTAGTQKVYAYNYGFASDALDYEIDRKEESISLAEFTQKGIDLLDNEEGFFMMVESGKIDWACHANDGASSIMDTLAFADSIDRAIEFYNKHPDETLIVVTGDHETGGLTLGFAGTGYETSFENISSQQHSYEYFDEYLLTPYLEAGNTEIDGLMRDIQSFFGLSDLSDYEMKLLNNSFNRTVKGEAEITNAVEDKLLYGGYTPVTMQLTHIQNNRSGLAWTSYKHTGVPVATFAKGAGEEMFHGYYDNTDIFQKIKSAMGM
ncbi:MULTISPECIES: alkaline phosphatase [unclassified Oceanispirochaeta]|uniref:alkaline phosphatase n=1 Tax=unclassified Oceanispirochaeta TaxID=2635722 RepID=UPI000E09BD2A|nr:MULTISPECIES: alkaline phosphatase [unclassified Oceanispirochaeta]MBF9017722.1 alkaline phosphatase [Oceanispirochaeta sp. M2]NPD72125.1 alkaline phosphatase [Oceanispirochaeta sp. M1]RDG32567.1 alkaline phosphatase [Oceanispirochaeta sp. M1]